MVLSFSTGKIQSAVLARYKTIQGFWQNLGISYYDIDNMTLADYEIYQGIMNIEAQFAEKNARKRVINAQKCQSK